MSARPRSRLTLVEAFVVATATVSVIAGGLLFILLETSRRSLIDSSERLRDVAAQRMEGRVSRDLGEASQALEEIERALHLGAAQANMPLALEPVVFTELSNHPSLADISFTHAQKSGYDAEGHAILAKEDRWQLSVFRATADPSSAVVTRATMLQGERFIASVRDRAPGGSFVAPLSVEGEARDPTTDLTFETTASQPFYGEALWSDLHYSELDAKLTPAQRRVVVTVQKAIEDASGTFLGVLRVGIRTQTLDEIAQSRVNDADPDDPHRIFICDAEGRLVTRLGPEDQLSVSGDDLRVQTTRMPDAIAQALRSPTLRTISREHPNASEVLTVSGRHFIATFRALANTQDWIVGIVVPEDYYTRDLRALRDRFLLAYAIVAAIVLVGGGLGLRALRRNLGGALRTTMRMREFDFAPTPTNAAFRDVEEVMDGLERAKTAMRALGKYVPVDLVRELYASNREPMLGGELRNVTLMFTDIRGFTNLAEKLAPDALAQALGHYLEAMTNAIRENGGTIDKYIGDAVMAIWNAPGRCEKHAVRACAAALACTAMTEALYASPNWAGLAPLFTRFGLHKDDVLIGHFGAPSRLSYTALGDGVNLAARLESLGKQYEVSILVSETVEAEARDAFVFRLVDRVAVKGKTKPVRVYELLGASGRVSDAKERTARTYERALEAYFQREFAMAQSLLVGQRDDGPSAVLYARCEAMRERPPSEAWDGVYVAATK